MDPQILPPPIFPHPHQMGPHKMNPFDSASIQKNYHATDRSAERRPSSFNYPSRTTSSTNYPSIPRIPERIQSPTPAASSSHRMEEHQPQKNVSSDTTILPHLQIPSSINSSGGSLAEFAAQVSFAFTTKTWRQLNCYK